MKVCEYCGSPQEDGAFVCPRCSSTSFQEKCPRCGNVYKGVVCPTCSAADAKAREEYAAQQEKAAAEKKANSGLVWKTALTVLLPFVGGYLLINDNVKKGFRVFGIIWCALLGFWMGMISGYAVSTKVIATLLCLAPIAVYLFKTKERYLEGGDKKKKLPLVAFVLLLVISLIGDVVGPTSNQTAPESKALTNTATADAPSSSSSLAADETKASVNDVTLVKTTEYLEYSNKQTDPVKLVKCSESKAKVTTNDTIDLSKVGTQRVSFKVSLDGKTAVKDERFTVRDTKAPTIKLSSQKVEIDQGSAFDLSTGLTSVSDVVDGDLARVEEEPVAQGTDVGKEVFYDAGWYIVDGSVNSAVPGTYSLVIKAVDKHGNALTKELLVTVKEAAVPVQEVAGAGVAAGAAAAVAAEAAPAAPTYTYILNTSSHKFHLPGCRDVAKMKDSNKSEITATREEVINMGYSPCGHCNP